MFSTAEIAAIKQRPKNDMEAYIIRARDETEEKVRIRQAETKRVSDLEPDNERIRAETKETKLEIKPKKER